MLLSLPLPLLLTAIIVAFALFITSIRDPLIPLSLLVATTQFAGFLQGVFGKHVVSYPDLLFAFALLGTAMNGQLSKPITHETRSPSIRLLLAFVAWMAISTLFSDNLRVGAIQTQRFLGFALLVYLTPLVANSPSRIRAMLLAIVVAMGLTSAIMISDQYLGTRLGRLGQTSTATSTGRQTGGHEDAGAAGENMVAGIVIAGMLAIREKKRRWLTVPALALMLVALPTTATRISIFLLGLSALVFLFKMRRSRYIAQVLILVAIAGVISLASLPATTKERFQSLTEPTQDSSFDTRMSVILSGWKMFKENPITGKGPGGFRELVKDFDYRWISGAQRKTAGLNSVSSLAAETGLVGLTLFSLMIIFVFRELSATKRRATSEEIATMSEVIEFAFLIFLMTTITGGGYRTMFFWIFPALALAIVRCLEPGSYISTPSDRSLGRATGSMESEVMTAGTSPSSPWQKPEFGGLET